MACWVLRLGRKSPPFHLALVYFWTLYHTMPKNARARKRPSVPSPAGRSPSPTLKVAGPKALTDEGKQPKSEKQATLNGSVSHSTWPVSLFWCGTPHPARAAPGPPSPEGKASSGGRRRSPAGAFPYLPLGEGGSAQPRRKRGRLPCVKGAVSRRLTEGSPCCRLVPPHTRQGFALPPSPGRGVYL